MNESSGVPCSEFRDLATEYLEGALGSSKSKSFERHRESCRTCDEFFGQMQLTIEALGSLNRQRLTDSISPALIQAFRKWKESTTGAMPEIGAVVEFLSRLEGHNLESAVGRYPVEVLPEIGGAAAEEAVRQGLVKPKRAIDFAAVSVAAYSARLKHREPQQLSDDDRLAEAWAILGNARRINSDLRGAGKAFQESERLLEGIVRGSSHRARALQLRAIYLAYCRNQQAASKSINEAIKIYQALGDVHLVGRALIARGQLHRMFGDPEKSARDLEQGLGLIDRNREPRLELVGKHNLLIALSESGARHEALQILEEVREHHRRLDHPVDLVRLTWLEGSLALDAEDLDSAEARFVEARDYFVENEIPLDAAIVSLGLAMVYLKQGRIGELKELAAEMVTIFKGLGVQRELFAAMAFFKKAVVIEQSAAVGLLQELVEVIEKSRRRSQEQASLGLPS